MSPEERKKAEEKDAADKKKTDEKAAADKKKVGLTLTDYSVDRLLTWT